MSYTSVVFNGVVNGMPRAGSHYNLGTSRGPDKIGSRAGPGPRAVSCTWLVYAIVLDHQQCFESETSGDTARTCM